MKQFNKIKVIFKHSLCIFCALIILIFPLSFTSSAGALVDGQGDINDYVKLDIVNLYVYNENITDPSDGIYIPFSSFVFSKVANSESDYTIKFTCNDDGSNVFKGQFLSIRLVFRVNFSEFITAFGEESLSNIAYDSLSFRLGGTWKVNETFPDKSSNWYSITRKFADGLYAERWHYYPGTAVVDNTSSSPTGQYYKYKLPPMASASMALGSKLNYYDIYCDYSFENTSISKNFTFNLKSFKYSIGPDEQQLELYPSFSSDKYQGVNDQLADAESAVLDGALGQYDSVKDDLFADDLFDANSGLLKAFSAVSEITSRFLDIDGINALFRYSVLFGTFALLLGLAVHINKGKDD